MKAGREREKNSFLHPLYSSFFVVGMRKVKEDEG